MSDANTSAPPSNERNPQDLTVPSNSLADRAFAEKTVGVQQAGGTSASSEHRLSLEDSGIEILGVLGRGGMGVVYRGRQVFLDRPVAVKVLPAGVPDDPREVSPSGEALDVARFKREAKLLAELHHPHIVVCYQAGVTGRKEFFLVMELIEGPNLKEYLTHHGPLSATAALALVRCMAQALAYAHGRGIIHRDVKPQNILLKPEPGAMGGFGYQPKLADLGLARYQAREGNQQEELTRQGVVVGTPTYMSPEQLMEPDSVDFRADIYALGCVLYQLVTGKSAYPQKSFGEILLEKMNGTHPMVRSAVPSAPAAIDELLGVMMARDANARPASYEALIASIDDASGRLEAGAVSAGAGRAAGGQPGSNGSGAGLMRIAVSLALVVLLTLVGHQFFVSSAVPPRATEGIVSADGDRETLAAPQPSASPEPTPLRRLKAEGVAAFTADTLPQWSRSGRASWGLDEEDPESSLIGVGSGALEMPIPPAPWRLVGILSPITEGAEDWEEVAIVLRHADGSIDSIHMQNFQPGVLVRHERRVRDSEPPVASPGTDTSVVEAEAFAVDVSHDGARLMAHVGPWSWESPEERPGGEVKLSIELMRAKVRLSNWQFYGSAEIAP